MINELTILDALQNVVQDQINGYIEDVPPIGKGCVVVEFPDVDLMKDKTVIYLQPNYSSYELMSTESDSAAFTVSVFIVCKRDKSENLTKKSYHYFNALYDLLRSNLTLDGVVDFVDVVDADYYPAVEGNKSVQAIEVSVSIRYSKDW